MDGEGGVLSLTKELTLEGQAGQYTTVADENLANRPVLRVMPQDANVITTQIHRQQPEIDIAVGQ